MFTSLQGVHTIDFQYVPIQEMLLDMIGSPGWEEWTGLETPTQCHVTLEVVVAESSSESPTATADRDLQAGDIDSARAPLAGRHRRLLKVWISSVVVRLKEKAK